MEQFFFLIKFFFDLFSFFYLLRTWFASDIFNKSIAFFTNLLCFTAETLNLNIQLGAPEYPRSAAANPSEFASMIRRKLTDEKRLVRIYGSDVVIARLTGDSSHARLHLLNYGSKTVEGLRVRLLGVYKSAKLSAPGGDAAVSDLVAADGLVEDVDVVMLHGPLDALDDRRVKEARVGT